MLAVPWAGWWSASSAAIGSTASPGRPWSSRGSDSGLGEWFAAVMAAARGATRGEALNRLTPLRRERRDAWPCSRRDRGSSWSWRQPGAGGWPTKPAGVVQVRGRSSDGAGDRAGTCPGCRSRCSQHEADREFDLLRRTVRGAGLDEPEAVVGHSVSVRCHRRGRWLGGAVARWRCRRRARVAVEEGDDAPDGEFLPLGSGCRSAVVVSSSRAHRRGGRRCGCFRSHGGCGGPVLDFEMAHLAVEVVVGTFASQDGGVITTSRNTVPARGRVGRLSM